jgi:hypothetical protein
LLAVLDISRHVGVYEASVQLVAALALDEDGRILRALQLEASRDGAPPLTAMLDKLYQCISVYLSRLAGEQLIQM